MITRLFVITIGLSLGIVNIVFAGWQEVGFLWQSCGQVGAARGVPIG